MRLEAVTALYLVEIVVCIGAVVTTLEMLSIRSAFRDEGLLSWRVQRLTHPLVWFLRRLGMDALLGYPGVLGLICVRLSSALAVIAAAAGGRSTTAPLAVLAFTTVLMTLRSSPGNDGSDQMTAIVIAAATLSEAVGTPLARSAGLVFIAGQASLAYATSGLLKVLEKGWRDGTFVSAVLTTSSFGNRRILALVKAFPAAGKVLGWCVGFGDCGLALAAVLPTCGTLLVLGYGVGLHLGISAVLGLNTFFWSFAATFPAILWVSAALHPHG